MSKRTPTNTSQQMKDMPMLGLAAASGSGGADQFIEEQEKNGQAELVHSDTIPSDMRGCRELMEQLGFQFGDRVKGDPLFMYATLPEGWGKKGTDHSMWSHIVDKQGRPRFAIFYKAAFYDRAAHISSVQRFYVNQDYDLPDGQVGFKVSKDDKVVHKVALDYEGKKYQSDSYQAAERKAKEQVETWLAESCPGWDDDIKQWEL